MTYVLLTLYLFVCRECNGNSYTINVPQQCVAGGASCGMIFGAHGFSQDPEEQDRNTNMRALGEEYDYVVVQPQGNPVRVRREAF